MSNDKVLLSVAVIAFILSLIGAIASLGMFSFTGAVSKDADAQLTVSENLEITFNTNTINWGSGRTDTGKDYAVLDSEGTVSNSSGGNAFNTVSNGLTLENLGNTNASIDLESGKDDENFIGGGQASDAPAPEYEWKVSNEETSSCVGTLSPTGYTNVSSSQTTVCNNFAFRDSQDLLGIDVRVKIPYDAPTTSKSDTITATATAV